LISRDQKKRSEEKVCSFPLRSCQSFWTVCLTLDWNWIFGLIALEFLSEIADQTELLSSIQKFIQIRSQSKVSSENQVWSF